MEGEKRATFTGSIGFVLAAAGSAVGLGNIWRFPYLAAKDGGGLFLVCYLILAVTFGFTLLTTEVSMGRKTRQGPLSAYRTVDKRFGFAGWFACLVPVIILPYYCAIGGWVFKYLITFLTGQGRMAAEDGYFTGFITTVDTPIVYMIVFLLLTALVIALGVDKGIEKLSRFMMPALFILIIAISVFSLTLSHTDADGVTRTGLQGLKMYVIPNLSGMTIRTFLSTIMDAMGQLFFSISVAMGIMVAYGSYMPKEADMMKSINQIEIFDTLVAFLAGLMIIPAIFTFAGPEGMSAGPGLMFIALPKVFAEMGTAGTIVGLIFFIMVSFAAITSSISIMEAVVASFMDEFKWNRKTSTIVCLVYAIVMGLIVCLGYNYFYFELKLPNGSVAQVLDLMDYISNTVLMPILALVTCIMFGWVVGPKYIIDEIESSSKKFGRKKLFIITLKYVAPIMLLLLLLQSFISF